MYKMSCFCKHNPCVNLVRVYEGCELIYTKEGYFEIVCPPKVCVKQRIIAIDKSKKTVRLIIKLFNFERMNFENISLVNEIEPAPKNICVNHIDGLWRFENGKIIVSFPELEELSVATIDYTAYFESTDSIESSIYIKDNTADFRDSDRVKKCKSTLKL